MKMLAGVTRGKLVMPELIVLYGPDGVGKSTFVASAPNPVFLGAEKGTSNLDVARMPTPRNFEDCQSAVSDLINEKHDFQTLGIDTLDWMEPLVWDKVCRDSGSTNIEQAYGGYGKGYTAALKLWQGYVGLLGELRDKKKMNVILLAHSQVKAFQDPQQNAAYDRYQLKLNDKASALVREFVDCVFFANFETYTKTDQNKKTIALGEGVRKMHTERRPAFDAKNRFNLPTEMALSWDEYVKAKLKSDPMNAASIMGQIIELSSQLKDEILRGKISESARGASEDPVKLNVILNRVRTLLSA